MTKPIILQGKKKLINLLERQSTTNFSCKGTRLTIGYFMQFKTVISNYCQNSEFQNVITYFAKLAFVISIGIEREFNEILFCSL